MVSEIKTINDLSERGLRTISKFGKDFSKIHVGPYGCGKTFVIMLAFGIYLKTREPGGNGYLLVAKTRRLAISNMGDILSDLFGDDFKITSSKKDGKKSKDAMLFGHRIYFGGMNDKESIQRVLGKSYAGIIIDELTSITEDHYKKLIGRLRDGDNLWIISSTNPNHPRHWVKQHLDKHPEQLEQWDRYDRTSEDAIKYYDRLTREYYGTPNYDRFVLGLWSAADGLVYGKIFNSTKVIESAYTGVEVANYEKFRIGVDYGMRNPTVSLLSGFYNGVWVVIKEFYVRNCENTAIIKNAIALMHDSVREKLDGIFIDPSASALIKDLQFMGVSKVFKANNSVVDGIAKVSTLLNTDKLFISDCCEETIAEMYQYKYNDNITDEDREDKIDKVNDHCMDALRYLVMGARSDG